MPMTDEVTAIQISKEQPGFVITPFIENILRRAGAYLKAGYPLHLTGPAGTGKTSVAMYIAAQLEKPAVLIHGDEEFNTSDLVGNENGLRRKKVVDNFIHSVKKTEESVARHWVDNRLTLACKHGFTLIYDEFTRSRPEANNVLLSVLEEKILDLPVGGDGYLRVHPDFSAIFTSNPQEYAGIHAAQDALRDRMITMNLGHYDRETEIAITEAKSGIDFPEAEKIVNIVRRWRESDHGRLTPTTRASVMIARVAKVTGSKISANDSSFVQICADVLDSGVDGNSRIMAEEIVKDLIKKVA